MCGILGFLSQATEKNKNNIGDFLHFISHRGPNDQGFWSDHHIQLGHTRLSILDLSPLGHQPMSYQNQRYWITFNGEIYNYLELKGELINLGYTFTSQTDTEVLLAAYSQWGRFCLDKLRGMFAFAIWDREEKQLFLARDRTGEKPLYYWYDHHNFYFASELKALVSSLPEKPALNPIAVDLYLHYQYVPEPLTPLSGVYKLPAAHYLLIDHDTWKIQPQPYWNLEQIAPVTGNPVELIRQELDRVIELTLRSDVPIGIALSGGIDSGAIAALAAPKYKGTLQTFSIGYPGRPPYDERKEAEELAKTLGLPFFDIELHTEELVTFFPELVAAMDDPIADIAAFGHYSVMKKASEHGIKVMLSGIGGDELFWGYAWLVEAAQLTEQKQHFLSKSFPSWFSSSIEGISKHQLYQRLSLSPKVPLSIRLLLNQGIKMEKMRLGYPQQAVYQNLVPDFQIATNYTQTIYHPEFLAQIPQKNAYQPFQLNSPPWEDIPIKICQLIFNTWLVSNCLSLSDRVSMASSVETRLPFLDHKLIELVMGLRKTQPDHELGQKYWLKQALQGILPDEVLNRPKRGFQPPVQEWMEGIILAYLDQLQSGYLIELKILNQEFMVKLIHEFKIGRQHTFILYKCLLLEIWYRQLVDPCSF